MSDGEGAGSGNAAGYTMGDVAKATVATVVLAGVLSLAYGPADHYSPLVYLNVVLAGAMGWAVGRCGRAMLRRFRIDGAGAATFVGVVGGLFAVWFCWLSYVWVLFRFDFSAYPVFANPSMLWELMEYLAENPAWSVTSRTGKAASHGPVILYYGVWLVEAVLFLYFAVRECRVFVQENRLCGRCRDWLRPTGDAARFAVPEEPGYAERLAAGDLSLLRDLPRLAEGDEAGEWLEARCFACGECEDLDAYVRVSHSVVKLDKNKKPRVVTSVLANMVSVSSELEVALFEPPNREPSLPE